MHARDRSIAYGVGAVCTAMAGRGMACLPFRKGDHVPEFLMLGYITAARWGWGTRQYPPGGLEEVTGLAGTPRNKCSWSLLEALGTLQAQGAPGMGRAVPVDVGVLGQLQGAW